MPKRDLRPVSPFNPNVSITKSHPKALLLALGLRDWKAITDRFGLDGSDPTVEHERDALIGAVAAREGSLGRWIAVVSNHPGIRYVRGDVEQHGLPVKTMLREHVVHVNRR